MQQADAGRLVDAYLEAALAGRREEAIDAVVAPLARSAYDLLELYEQVLAPAAARVGDLWHAGEISIAEEHLVTRTTRETMARARQTAPPPRRGRSLTVLACPPDEQHEVGLEMVGDVLDAAGFDVRLLGAATPARDLARYVAESRPAVVLLSCATPLAIPSLLDAVHNLRATSTAARVVVGGRAAALYRSVCDAAGADAFAPRLSDAVDVVAELVPA